jgi:hypothetical protein
MKIQSIIGVPTSLPGTSLSTSPISSLQASQTQTPAASYHASDQIRPTSCLCAFAIKNPKSNFKNQQKTPFFKAFQTFSK